MAPGTVSYVRTTIPTTHGPTKQGETLADRFYALLPLPEDSLERALARLIRVEDELPEPARYESALGRLRAWLELDSEDARIIAGAYERALERFPDGFRARRIEAERAALMNGLTFGDFRLLTSIIPWLRDEVHAQAAHTFAA